MSGLSDIVAVAAGGYHSMALTSTGTLYVWGANGNGQVGDASTTVRNTPVQSNLTGVVAIAAGEYHSVALKANGDVYTWGKNTTGQRTIIAKCGSRRRLRTAMSALAGATTGTPMS